MPETIWVQLGLAAPLVGILMYLLKQSTDERKVLMTQFLAALTTTVEQSNEQRLRASTELAQLTETLRDDKKRSSEEHARAGEEHVRIVEAIDRLSPRKAR